MRMGFRWYGEGNDPITLDYIRQIPKVTEVVWALHHKQAGEVWEEDEIKAEVEKIKAKGLGVEIVESVNVHDDIKLGLDTRDELIENYKTTLRNLAKYGVKVVTYNFMPIFDWTRSDMFHPLPDGSTALYFDREWIENADPQELIQTIQDGAGDLTMPGWEPERLARIEELFELYDGMTEEQLLENYKYFIDAIIPTAEEVGIKMAIHPDDPPFEIFGLPRLFHTQEATRRLLAVNDSPNHGLCFDPGCLGSRSDNDIPAMMEEFIDRIVWIHIRNVYVDEKGNFCEVSHLTEDGTVPIDEVVRILYENDFDGVARPDHGRHIFGEDETNTRPGYGLYDRALGITYLNGLWDAYKLMDKRNK